MLREIGGWEKHHAQVEETIGPFKFDVTWRKQPHGVPRWVFEVELSGNIANALTRLKNAQDKWNAELVLVTTTTGEVRAKKLLEEHFIDIKDRCKIWLVTDVVEKYQYGKRYFTQQ